MKEILGSILLIVGLGIIIWGLYSSYNIFTGKAEPPVIFEVSPLQTQGSSSQIGSLLQEQLKGLIPIDFAPKILNLVAWSIFMGILIWGGSQISGLGIKLMK